jgi:hypothetical protein
MSRMLLGIGVSERCCAATSAGRGAWRVTCHLHPLRIALRWRAAGLATRCSSSQRSRRP